MKLRFLCGWPQDVAGGSGTAVMLDGLREGLNEIGVESDVLTPPQLPDDTYRRSTLRRRAWNRRLNSPATFRGVDAVIGIDWDGCDLPPDNPTPHFALLCALMAELRETETGTSGRLLRIQAEWEQRHVNQVNRVIVNSDHSANIVQRLYGVSPDRISKVPHGIDALFLDTPLPSQAPSESPIAFACAKMYPRKQIPLLVEAWGKVIATHPSAHLKIAGDGPDLEAVQSKIEEHGLAHSVELLGMVSDRRRMLALFDQSDVFVHPSIQESFGLVYIEAMARAKPVIAAHHGPAIEWIGDNERGLLAAPKSAESLADAIIQVFSDRSAAMNMGKCGHAFAQRFRWRAAAKRLRAEIEREEKRLAQRCKDPE